MVSSRIVITGVQRARSILDGISSRAADASPAYDRIADDVFVLQRRFWAGEYGGKADAEKRPGRNPRYMHESGTLEGAVTLRGAPAQFLDIGPDYLFVSVRASLVGLAEIHRRRGREVFDEPSRVDADRMAERVGEYILTGQAN